MIMRTQNTKSFSRIFFCLIFFICFSGMGFAKTVPSETILFSQINSSFKSDYYPATIVKADEFLDNYEFSLHKNSVILMIGESQFFLGKYAEAIETLSNLINSNPEAAYYAGRSNFELGNYTKALNNFYFSIDEYSGYSLHCLNILCHMGYNLVYICLSTGEVTQKVIHCK